MDEEGLVAVELFKVDAVAESDTVELPKEEADNDEDGTVLLFVVVDVEGGTESDDNDNGLVDELGVLSSLSPIEEIDISFILVDILLFK